MKQYLLLCASMFLGLTACSSGNNSEETDDQVVSKKQIIFNQTNNKESFYDDSNVEFNDGKYTFSGGSCKIKNEILLLYLSLLCVKFLLKNRQLSVVIFYILIQMTLQIRFILLLTLIINQFQLAFQIIKSN